MAIFSNQATLTVNGNVTNSNIAYGELLEVLSGTKSSVEGEYGAQCPVTYIITLRNTGNVALTNLTLTDDLGGYDFNGTTVYPLNYVADSVKVFADGVAQTASAVTAGPPLVFSGITVPANGDTVLIYQARTTAFADPSDTGSIVNTATVAGAGLTTPITVTATTPAQTEARLSITKSISPAQVTDNSEVTYTFVIQNYGSAAVIATDNAAVTDTFDPILSSLNVTLDGTALALGTGYTYDENTGLFSTVPGEITVPAANVTQDATTGEYTVTPGTATLTVTGTI